MENPTTGFCWQLAPFDAVVLRLEFDEYQIAAGAGVGGGGRRLFHFATTGPGHINLRFELKRAWEAQGARETFAITVVVR